MKNYSRFSTFVIEINILVLLFNFVVFLITGSMTNLACVVVNGFVTTWLLQVLREE